MRKLLISVALSVFTALPVFAGAADTPATVTLKVSNMTCELCPVTVKKALQGVHGVVSAKADLATKTAVVNYDPNLTSPQALIQATTHAGFPSTVKQ